VAIVTATDPVSGPAKKAADFTGADDEQLGAPRLAHQHHVRSPHDKLMINLKSRDLLLGDSRGRIDIRLDPLLPDSAVALAPQVPGHRWRSPGDDTHDSQWQVPACGLCRCPPHSWQGVLRTVDPDDDRGFRALSGHNRPHLG